jgi:hypothetical protein
MIRYRRNVAGKSKVQDPNQGTSYKAHYVAKLIIARCIARCTAGKQDVVSKFKVQNPKFKPIPKLKRTNGTQSDFDL